MTNAGFDPRANTTFVGLIPLTVNGVGPDDRPDDFVDVEWLRAKLAEIGAKWPEINRKLYDGKHWLNGDGWTGPRPPTDDLLTHTSIMAEVERSFISKNCIAETADRAHDGVLGREATWGFTPDRDMAAGEAPNAAEAALISEANSVTTTWWDKRKGAKVFSEAVLNGILGSRGVARFFLPRAFVDADGNLKPGTALQWARRISVEAPVPSSACVVEDPDTLRQFGVYAYKDKRQRELLEVVFIEGDPESENAKTVIQTIERSNAGLAGFTVGVPLRERADPNRVVNEGFYELRGGITIGEFECRALITEQVRKLQFLVNQALTMAQHNINLAGFLERVILNGQYPGHYVPDTTRPGKQIWVADKYQVGAGAVNFIVGLPIYNEAGQMTGMTNPSVIYRDPVDVASFEKTVRLAYRSLLEETHQVHALVAGEEYPSGESRRQARADFESFLRGLKKKIDAFGRWYIETVLTLIAFLSGDRDRFAGLRVTFDCRIDPGPATAESIRAAIELNAAYGLSNESMMYWSGVDDPQAEQNRIQAEQAAGILNPTDRAAERALKQAELAAQNQLAVANARSTGGNPRIPLGENDQRREGAGANA